MKIAQLVERKPWIGWLLFAATAGAVFAAGVIGASIVERRQESAALRAVNPIAEWEPRNEVWGADHPRELETWKQTADTSFVSAYGGSAPRDLLEEDPRLVVLWAGYPFSRDYKQARGHAYAIDDIRSTLRTTGPMPATCWTCKSPDVPRLMDTMGVADYYKGKWADLGSQVVNTIGCKDCHDPKTMDLRISRPALVEAWGRMGKDVRKATHQEMRSLVCAQCHVEYYFAKDSSKPNYLTFPWDSGFSAERMEKYYDNINFYDFVNKVSKVKVIKAQHPDYEVYMQGTHGKRGVSCADCHMPYKSEGAVKFTDHHVVSPLKNMANACMVCHRQSEETLRNDVYARQQRVQERKYAVEDQLVRAHLEAAQAWKDSATEAEMEPALKKIRHAQWRWDWVAAGNSLGFHAPEIVQQTLGEAMQIAQEARVEITRIRARHGKTDTVAIPDISTKIKAQSFIGLNMDSLRLVKVQQGAMFKQWDSAAKLREAAMSAKKGK
ncbi:MAG: ammonia-forming cytochrome c nitrite reductase subunit c552 [Fibrobacterota bacterium]